ncbi:Sulfotransferase domain protein [Stieleria maiorica]|uniref:Sulfotransferase domain protein n=1 Tax=Stieleria maiorica TaxID=2795974 RepID=A0A5B9MJ28_9BACT|nr:sulfotransferase [Stieleria maiorica]QEF99615.1 Sulfotransferase domain protein [Stieleria maiorica]
MTSHPTDESPNFDAYYERIKNEPTYIILGAQGSGTNFLSRILGRTLDFSVTLDRSLIVNAAANLCRDRSQSRAQVEAKRIVQSLFPGPIRKRLLSKRFFNKNRKYTGIEKHLRHAITDSPADFANFFYSYHAFVDGKSHKGIKSDDIWENIDLLHEIIPNYRVLLLIRDPRDNTISIMKKNFGPREIYNASRYVRNRMDHYISFADRDPQRTLLVKYEDLLTNPYQCAMRVAKFADCAIPDTLQQQIANLNIRPNKHRKWKKLSERDLATTETVFADLLDRFDYERGASYEYTPTGLQCAARNFKDLLLRIPQKAAVKTRRYVRG